MADKFLRRHLITFLAILILGSSFVLDPVTIASPASGYKEIDKILSTNNLAERVIWYRQLIERVGTQEAQEALVRSGPRAT